MTSIGFVARDINSPKYYGTAFKPIYETSLAIRPWNERLALAVNWLARAEVLEDNLDEPQPTSFFTFGLDYELLHGLVLKLGADEDRNFSASLSLLFGQGGLGTAYSSVKGEGDEKDSGFGALMVTAGSSWRESVLMPPSRYLEIDLSGQIAEAKPPFRLFGGGGPRYTLGELLMKIDYAKQSRDIQAMVLRCGGIAANFAIYDELRRALIDFRNAGKTVIAYVENPGNGVYYLATASDYIILTPNGYIGLVGLRSETPFIRGTLDKLGVKAYYARVGKYKSAVEPLTEDEFTGPSREARNALLDDVYAKMVRDIASGRGFTQDEVRDKIDRGPYIPSEALKEDLVDTLAYWDEVPKIVNRLVPQVTGPVPYRRFADRKPANLRWDESPVIGIVYGVGGITSGSNRRDMFIGDIMGSETITAALRKMREDRSVRAVVFRVDSPGGMMTASDKIRREVEITTKKKPVIISMGGVAASGGYHVSCDGTVILADEATVTGSIGVLNLWLLTRGLYEKIGANKDIFLRGEHADIFPTWRDVTDEDIDLAQYYTDKFYNKFVSDVAEGRAMGFNEVHEIAQGRVWSGRRAQELGLVDRIGGLAEAIETARKEAGISPDETVEFKVLPEPPGFFEALTRTFSGEVVGDIQMPEELKQMMGEAAYLTVYDDPILYLMPDQIEIK
jgi:protease-4